MSRVNKSKKNSKQKRNYAKQFKVEHLLTNSNSKQLLKALYTVEPEIFHKIMEDVPKPFIPSNTNNKMPQPSPSLKNNNGIWKTIDKLVGKKCSKYFEDNGYYTLYSLLGLYLSLNLNKEEFLKELKIICPKMTRKGYVHCYNFVHKYVETNM